MFFRAYVSLGKVLLEHVSSIITRKREIRKSHYTTGTPLPSLSDCAGRWGAVSAVGALPAYGGRAVVP